MSEELTTNCGKLPFCLSDKMIESKFMKSLKYKDNKILMAGDVKEFIKIVEAIMMDTRLSRREKIDRLHERAGKGLI